MNLYSANHIVKNMPLGYALHKFLKDDTNQPYDYIFIDINQAFEEHTGLKAADIIGKSVTDILPDIKQDSFNWIEAYAKVAYQGESFQIKQYSYPLKKWYQVYAYQHTEGYFITLVEDINEKVELENQNIYLKTELKFKEIITEIYYEQYTNERAFFDDVLKRAVTLTESEYGYIFLDDTSISGYRLSNTSNLTIKDDNFEDHILNDCLEKLDICDEVIKSRKHIIINDKNIFKEESGLSKSTRLIENTIAIPIFDKTHIVAIVGLANKKEGYSDLNVNQLTFFMQNAWNIKKQKELESELSKFSIIVENALHGSIITDLSGYIVYVNKFYASRLGYCPVGLLGKPISVLYSDKQMEKAELLLEKVLREGRANLTEVWHKDKNDKEFPMLMSGIIIEDDWNSPEYIAIFAIDITDLKQAKAKTEQSSSLLLATLESTADGFVIVNTQDQSVMYNQRFVDMWQIPQKVMMKNSREVVLSHIYAQLEKSEQAQENVQNLNNYLEASSYDLINLKDGRIFERYSQPYKQGQEIVGRVWSFRDVTQTIKSEEELRRFKTISDNALYGKIIADLNGKITYTNDFFARIHGYSSEELKGKHVSVLHTPEQVIVVNRLIENIIEKGSFEISKVWHMHRDGSEFPMLMSGMLLENAKGKPQYIAATAVDITVQHQMEENLRYLAYHDYQTGAYNRRYLDKAFAEIDTEEYWPLALIMADINGLKMINDDYGQLCGDELIKMVVNKINEHVKEGIVARLGGDEFGILVKNATKEKVITLIRKLENILNFYLNTDCCKEVLVSVSFGYSLQTTDCREFSCIYTESENNLRKEKLLNKNSIHYSMSKLIIPKEHKKAEELYESR